MPVRLSWRRGLAADRPAAAAARRAVGLLRVLRLDHHAARLRAAGSDGQRAGRLWATARAQRRSPRKARRGFEASPTALVSREPSCCFLPNS